MAKNRQRNTSINLNNCQANNCNAMRHRAIRCLGGSRSRKYLTAIAVRDDCAFLTKYLDLDLSAIAMIALFVMRYVDSILAITFDVGHQMTRRLHHSKALVEAHLFRGVSKIEFFDRSGQTEPPPENHHRPPPPQNHILMGGSRD